jgi:hypothetical protein
VSILILIILSTHALFFSLRFGGVGMLCLLDVAIPGKHISLFYHFPITV